MDSDSDRYPRLMSTATAQDSDYDADPIWSSSRTARQIHELGRVEKDIGRLLSLASSSLALLALPQTDPPDATLPQGDERSEQFVAEVGQYFETLDGIQMALRSSLAHIRAARISPAVLTAPLAGFVPPPQGVGLPLPPHLHPHPPLLPPPPDTTIGASAGAGNEGNAKMKEKTRGLLEELVERDAWHGVLDALTRLRDARRAEVAAAAAAEAERKGTDVDSYMSVAG